MKAWHGWALLSLSLLASCASQREHPLDINHLRFSISATKHAFHGMRPLVLVNQENRCFPALADTGSSRSLVVVPDAQHRAARRVTGSEWIGSQGTPLEGVPVTIWLNNAPHPGFAVAESSISWGQQFPLILGLDMLREYQVVFDYVHRETVWGNRTPSSKLKNDTPALFVIFSAPKEWIILDTGSMSSHYLTDKAPLNLQMPRGLTFHLESPEKLSRDMQSNNKCIGVLGMDRQCQMFCSFSAASGRLIFPKIISVENFFP